MQLLDVTDHGHRSFRHVQAVIVHEFFEQQSRPEIVKRHAPRNTVALLRRWHCWHTASDTARDRWAGFTMV